MQNFYYVYILIDTATETHHYVGSTKDLSARLAKHNAGEVPHTSKFKPWCFQTAIAFDSKEKAEKCIEAIPQKLGTAYLTKPI